MTDKLPIAVLISGRGSNFAALADAASKADYPAKIVLVISNRKDAGGLEIAEANGIPSKVIDHRVFESRESFDAALHDALTNARARLVCLAGFMRLLTEGFVRKWQDRLINIHPSLLPAFKGLDTHARVLASGVRFTGCTVHFVRPEMDTGPIIVQSVVPVRPSDDEDALAARVLDQEHRCYAQAVRWFAEDRLEIIGETVHTRGLRSPQIAQINPTDTE